MTTTATFDDVEVQLAREARELALSMVRFETWAREAADQARWGRMVDFEHERDRVRERRSMLLRELWKRRQKARV